MKGNLRGASLSEKAAQSLWNNCEHYIQTLGKPAKNGSFLVFPGKLHPFAGFRICYVEEKKFLGKFYAMLIEGKIGKADRKDLAYGSVELLYTGFITKGMPFFKPVKKATGSAEDSIRLANRLNKNKELLYRCRDLDLELLKVSYDTGEEVWRIYARPYGGSMVHIMLPPMTYNVILPKQHAEGIMVVMKTIAEMLQSRRNKRN